MVESPQLLAATLAASYQRRSSTVLRHTLSLAGIDPEVARGHVTYTIGPQHKDHKLW